MKRVLLSVALLAVASVMMGTTARASQTTGGGSGSDSTMYNDVNYTIFWTDYVTAYYTTDSAGDMAIYSQVQGGCYTNPDLFTVDGSVTYYWSGGSQGPINSTIQNQEAVICGSGEGVWGDGPTYDSPNIIYYTSDPAHTDYAYVYSQWYCGSCLPWSGSESSEYFFN